MKKTLILSIVAMAALALILGCKKEQENNNTDETVMTEKNVSKGMLRFSSAEEFAEMQQKVLAMGEYERREWERQQGFKSYATKCYELLEELESKGISTPNDIYDFVKENVEFFYIREENGERYLENYLENSLYRFFVNESQMITMNDVAMKFFADGVVIAPVGKINELCSVNGFENMGVIDELSFYPIENEIIEIAEYGSKAENGIKEIKDKIWRDAYSNTKWSYIGQRIKTGLFANANRNVTKVYLERYIHSVQTVNDVPSITFHWKNIGTVKPYHRIAGIWFVCQRTKTYNIHTEWSYDDMPSSDKGYDTSKELKGIGGYERIFLNKDYPTKPVEFRYNVFRGWSSTSDTPRINFPLPDED